MKEGLEATILGKLEYFNPAASPVLSKGAAGSHKIQGLGAGFRRPRHY